MLLVLVTPTVFIIVVIINNSRSARTGSVLRAGTAVLGLCPPLFRTNSTLIKTRVSQPHIMRNDWSEARFSLIWRFLSSFWVLQRHRVADDGVSRHCSSLWRSVRVSVDAHCPAPFEGLVPLSCSDVDGVESLPRACAGPWMIQPSWEVPTSPLKPDLKAFQKSASFIDGDLFLMSVSAGTRLFVCFHY